MSKYKQECMSETKLNTPLRDCCHGLGRHGTAYLDQSRPNKNSEQKHTASELDWPHFHFYSNT